MNPDLLPTRDELAHAVIANLVAMVIVAIAIRHIPALRGIFK